MRASFRGAVLITIIVVYAPTASRMDIEKESFYDDLGGVYEKWQSKGPTYIIGDWNARLQQCRP
eukprot:12899998-Prorocentrum_lima.AAC.1